MSSCLGLYIERNVIKYAKVTKERDVLKTEAFGIKFYDRLNEAIEQIVSETSSQKIPISVNLSEEVYNYFHMFNLLNKNDLKMAIQTEFESYCFDKKMNKDAYEGRYTLANSLENKDKIKVIHVGTSKASISKILQLLGEGRVAAITPIGTSISSIAPIKPKENIMIVNIEEKTTVTTIIDQRVYNVDVFEEGSEEILNKINNKENSYSKAYEICKNSTIYTMDGAEFPDEANEYMEDIMPTLYKLANKLQEYVGKTEVKFDKIYITGTMSAVNNIDLYFQEFFTDERCEILKPYFIAENIKINVKDYIEVNSAIALALQGLGYGIKELNFKNQGFMNKLPELMTMDIGSKEKRKKSSGINFNGFSGIVDNKEKLLSRIAGVLLMFFIVYSVFSGSLSGAIQKKTAEAEEVKEDTKQQIELIEKDDEAVKQKTNNYIEMSDGLRGINRKIQDGSTVKGDIPDFLMQIMYIIPEDVKLTQIENTTGKHIVINAESKKYEQLGYFKAKIKEDNILEKDTVVSSQGETDGDFIKVVIEGDLP